MAVRRRRGLFHLGSVETRLRVCVYAYKNFVDIANYKTVPDWNPAIDTALDEAALIITTAHYAELRVLPDLERGWSRTSSATWAHVFAWLFTP